MVKIGDRFIKIKDRNIQLFCFKVFLVNQQTAHLLFLLGGRNSLLVFEDNLALLLVVSSIAIQILQTYVHHAPLPGPDFEIQGVNTELISDELVELGAGEVKFVDHLAVDVVELLQGAVKGVLMLLPAGAGIGAHRFGIGLNRCDIAHLGCNDRWHYHCRQAIDVKCDSIYHHHVTIIAEFAKHPGQSH